MEKEFNVGEEVCFMHENEIKAGVIRTITNVTELTPNFSVSKKTVFRIAFSDSPSTTIDKSVGDVYPDVKDLIRCLEHDYARLPKIKIY